MSITIRMKGTATKIVTENDTAKVVKSGSLPVLATPVLSALMEEAACDAVKEGLAEGETTVGGFIGLAITLCNNLSYGKISMSAIVASMAAS